MTHTAATLLGQLYRTLCVNCLASEVGSTLDEADRIARDLSDRGRFVRDWFICGRCHEHDLVMAHVPVVPVWSLGHGPV